MNSIRFTYNENEEKMNAKHVPEELQSMLQPETHSWRMSYILVKSGQQNSYKGKLQSGCPADIKTLKRCTRVVEEDAVLKQTDDEVEEEDRHFREYETELGPKMKIWDEYRKLMELARSMPRTGRPKSLTHVTSLQKIRIGREHLKSRPCLVAQATRSIIRAEEHKEILVADSNYVQFRNFQLKKLYKKTVTLQNVTTSPAKFRMEARPYRSKFTVIIKSTKGNRNIVPAGMQLQLIILFRCDVTDEPEEVLVLNVEHGRPLIIRLHGYKDPPILLGTDVPMPESSHPLRSTIGSSVQAWRSEIVSTHDSTNSTMESSSESVDSWDSTCNKFVSITFDCKKGFVGERVYVPMRFRNVGGDGRFFIMSEVDWSSMYIEDVTDTNMLKLASFTISPAYFLLETGQQITLHMYFLPNSYGIHVDKLYILCDNLKLLPTEVIGDGIIYEPNFIQISKQLEKIWPFEWDIDKRAKYYMNLNISILEEITQCTICVSNISEIGMQFRWEKRNAETDVNEINEKNHFPLSLLQIHPDHGIFAPTAVHYFTVTAESKDLLPNCYFAVLQLYVEDIPVAAISKELELCTEECTARRRSTSNSVDVWIADVEVWLRYIIDDESKTDRPSEEALESISDSFSCTEYELQEQDETDTMDLDECKSTHQLVADELFSHYDFVNLKQFEPILHEKIISMGIIRPTRTLFVGIEETFVLTVRNLSTNSLNFTWGEARGLDAAKMRFCVCPEKGEVAFGDTEQMRITLTPVKEGIVQFLHVPCFVGDSQKIIMLGIECFIEPPYVTFYLPLNDKDSLQLWNNFTRVEWRADSLQVAFDLAGKSRKNMKILDKYKMREERELMTTNLDQGDVLKDASAGPSVHEVNMGVSREQSSSSAHTSEIVQNSATAFSDQPNDMSDQINSSTKAEEHLQSSIVSTGRIVPFLEAVLPPLTQPVVIEFSNLSLKSVEKKTFVIKNETPIPLNFSLRMKNFYPVSCSCDLKSREDRIKFLYRQVFGRNKDLIEESLCRVKQPTAGVVIYVDPLSADIGPFEAVPVDIYAFADTWGVYVDELEINITGLPLYTLAICVQVIGSPISLPFCEGTSSRIPTIKYGVVALGTRLQPRRISLKNTSVVPIAIDWHSFVVKPATKMPFNVVVDVCTPFTDDLASKLRASKRKTDSEAHLEKHIASWINPKLSDKFDFDSISGSDVDVNASSTSDDTTASTYS